MTSPAIVFGTKLLNLHRLGFLGAWNRSCLFSNDANTDDNVLVVTKRDGSDSGIVELCLNRHPKTLNALNTPLVSAIINALTTLKKTTDTRVIIFKSSCPKVFCAGMDVKESGWKYGSLITLCGKMINEIKIFPFPAIAALDGVTLGGGLEVVMNCDILVGSESLRAGLVEAKLGVIPGGAGHVNLSRLVGTKMAKEMIFTGAIINAERCKEYGLIQHLVPQNESNNAAYLRALEIARKILLQAPLALRNAKSAIDMSPDVDYQTAVAYEKICFTELGHTKDAEEGFKAFFEKRKPNFKGE